MILSDSLRKSVLQSAMLGQLTERLSEGENIELTLDNIQMIRRELVSSKEMKKDRTLFPTMGDEENLDIPDSWRWVQLGTLCKKIGAGSTPTGGKAVYVTKGIKFIREQNVHNDGLRLNDVAYIKSETHASMKGSQVKPNDILLNITGASIGRNSLVPKDFDTANINQHVLIIRLVDERMAEYIHYCLMSPIVYSQMLNKQKGDKPGLSAQRVGEFLIPIPPIQEQILIVEKIKKLIPEIDAYAKDEMELINLQNSITQKMTSSIIQAAMQGKMTDQRESDSSVDDFLKETADLKTSLIKAKILKNESCVTEIDRNDLPYDIPINWRWAKFADLCVLISGSDLKPECYNSKGLGLPYLTGASNIDVNGQIIINRWVENPKSIAQKGDLLLTCKGTIGKMAILKEEKVHIARQIMAIRPIGCINKDYIMICVRNYTNLLNRRAKSMIPGIERSNVLNLLIPVPPIEEQERIVNKVNRILPLVEEL